MITEAPWSEPEPLIFTGPPKGGERARTRRTYRHCRAMYAALQHRVSKGFYAKAD